MGLTPLLTTRLEISAVLAVVVVGVIALKEHDAKIKEQAVAQAVVDTAKKDQATYAQQVSDLAKQMADRDAAYQQQMRALDTRLQQAQSPGQIATLAAQVMGLKQPIQIIQPAPTAENPHPAPVAEVSTLDAPQVKAYVQQCEECKLNISKATADAADRQAQANLAQLQIDSLKKENTALVVQAKGGTVLKRTLKILKVAACATAGGAAGGASGKGAIPAAIGAGAGAVACSLF
jgi:hypothetical protein